MQNIDDLLHHINKVEELADQLAYLEVPVKDKYIIIILLESLPTSFEYLITAMETMPMKELTMDYVTAHLMHEMSKCKEKEPQGEDAAMVLWQGKGTTYFCAKAQNRVIIVANHATLYVFTTKQRTRNENKPRIRMMMTTTHL